MQGILLIDKPKNWTSFDVVHFVRKQVSIVEDKRPKSIKVGHTGTLDPLATGLLVLLVGKDYTRRAGELTKLDKTYEVTMKLGEVSATGDEEGEKRFISSRRPTYGEIESVLQQFTGKLMQTPPVFSAMKIGGQRAYKLARAGTFIELEARPISVYANKLTNYTYPYIQFTSEVGSGTYIRSLVEDIGEALGTGAYTSELRRVRIGQFDIATAWQIDTPELITHLYTL